MNKLTSVRFPISSKITKDDEGFNVIDDIQWGSDSYPAKLRDATNTESVKASQLGYSIEKVFEVRCYAGASVLIDEADGAIYDIKRAYSPEHSWRILLECERRKSGRGY